MAELKRTWQEHGGELRSELLSDQAYALLRRAIVAGDLQPGERIVESEIARELGVSQAPVREAVKRLVHEGLVMHVRRRGSYVTSISDEEAEQARQVRTGLEEMAGRLAAGRTDEDALAAMTGDVDAMRQAAADGDVGRFRASDIAFHRKVCTAGGNVFLVRLWDVMEPSLRSLRAVSDPLYSGDWAAMAESHAELLDLLRAGDPDKAAAAFKRHASGHALAADQAFTR